MLVKLKRAMFSPVGTVKRSVEFRTVLFFVFLYVTVVMHDFPVSSFVSAIENNKVVLNKKQQKVVKFGRLWYILVHQKLHSHT